LQVPPASTSPEFVATLHLEDAKLLISLCLQGKLYEVEKWIAEGKSLHVPPECKATPLRVALERGFHSLVELLARNDSGQKVKNDALIEAVSLRNMEFVQVLLNHGAQISCVPFSHVLLNWDPVLIRFFLDRGADFITGWPFTEAFTTKIRTSLRPFLECKRNHPDLAHDLQKQADSALRYFCDAGNEKWVSLMLWGHSRGLAAGTQPEGYAVAIQIRETLRVIADHGVEIQRLRVREIGVRDWRWRGGPISGKQSTQARRIVARAEVVVVRFGVALLAFEFVILSATAIDVAFTAERIKIRVIAKAGLTGLDHGSRTA